MDELEQKIIELSSRLKGFLHGNKIAIAESCTGGLLAYYITCTPGSSDYFLASVVGYSNEAKVNILDVARGTIAAHGAVSWQVAKEMALGAKAITGADLALSITGIAGPDGGSAQKPVGTVCFAVAYNGECHTYTHHFAGSRDDIRKHACYKALELIFSLYEEQGY
jgi:PncC family amidohydrolase